MTMALLVSQLDLSDRGLVTAAEAHRRLGIPAGTIRSWASRDWLPVASHSSAGAPLYSLALLTEAEYELRTNGSALAAFLDAERPLCNTPRSATTMP